MQISNVSPGNRFQYFFSRREPCISTASGRRPPACFSFVPLHVSDLEVVAAQLGRSPEKPVFEGSPEIEVPERTEVSRDQIVESW